jgi:hypothetical protein
MKKNKQLVKVVGTIMTGAEGNRLTTEMARGISPLKHRQTMLDFISRFLVQRGITSYAVNQRSEKTWATSPIMNLQSEPKTVVTYHFIEFPLNELGYHAKDLSEIELDRDMKLLKRLI